MSAVVAVIDDLREEGDELDALVAVLDDVAWRGPTPAAGWTVAHQIAHLAWTDAVALLATTEPERFGDEVARALAAPETFVDEAAEALVADHAPHALLARWRGGRQRLDKALRDAPAGTRIPWYGPPMSVASLATARLMETWAHGQDIADALGVTRTPTARLRHVARIGVRARNYAYAVRGTTPPEEEFRVELRSPGGEVIAYGPEGAAQRVTGPLLDFCLLVTRRAHRADLAVTAEGREADQWLSIAQAFAGPPGPGRPPRAEQDGQR
ncbi:TIGR03084 family metal-binding protein [Streptomyces sp. C11-1]|uniref:TIGR03084 family metal-binding protein n=1 Tax=Streptomyces durocortorensis TaxID=2811104 RepID=A0ABY9VY82_9ACTN|nr:TIGR03084 family metal-binding protein [Streptomyces durocortorensis]WNF28743.1 TIGR03084 family metal-binding protein [Streptomyces durocortorensis]